MTTTRVTMEIMGYNDSHGLPWRLESVDLKGVLVFLKDPVGGSVNTF